MVLFRFFSQYLSLFQCISPWFLFCIAFSLNYRYCSINFTVTLFRSYKRIAINLSFLVYKNKHLLGSNREKDSTISIMEKCIFVNTKKLLPNLNEQRLYSHEFFRCTKQKEMGALWNCQYLQYWDNYIDLFFNAPFKFF